MPLNNIPSDLTSNLTVVYTPLPHINSKTIECNTPAFTHWLNDMVDRLNDNSYRIVQLVNAVQELTNAVICLEEAVNALTLRVESLEEWRPTVEFRLTQLQNLIDSLQGQIDIINGQISTLQNTVNNNHGPRITSLETDMSWYNNRLPRSKTVCLKATD